jgi:uncharacterized metal-binding protein YceD (DUF177 family)
MSETSVNVVETEWSYFWPVDELKADELKLTLSPDADERARLAQRLGLISLDNLKADIVVSRRMGEVAYTVKGYFAADVVQKCVVTLEPVPDHVEDEFEAWYADPDAAVPLAKARHEKLNEKGHGELPVLDERDDPEALIDGKIDLGELVTQYLALSINPYPHAEGAEEVMTEKLSEEPEEAEVKNPFAALKDWKDKMMRGEDP